jgi:hypothetical protein
MRKALMGVLCVVCLIITAVSADSAPADNAPPPGFVALFNGKDLTGWKGLLDPKKKLDNPAERAKLSPENLAEAQKEADENMREHWAVQDGMLVFDGKGRSLATMKDYGDFEMYVDWKIKPAGDSGIYLRGTPQVQIWDTDHKDYFKHGADKGSGALWNNQKNERFPKEKADKPAGEWNTFWIKMVGDKVWVKLNGKLVTDGVVMENFWERDKPLYPTGQIELQNHGNTLYFKNIYIKELPREGAAK